MLPNYALDYDEELDATCSLELLAEHLPKVVTVPYHWKWVVLSLHNSLQGFMVLALQGTNQLNVLTKKSAIQWSVGNETGNYGTKPFKLEEFMGLYAKVKSGAMEMRIDSAQFAPEGTQDENVGKLNAIRNDLVHYIPALSLLDMRAWTRIVLDVVPIIEFLAFSSRNVTFHQPQSEDRVRGLCALAKSEASALLVYYGA